MAYRRTTRKVGSTRVTTTYNSRTGRTTVSNSIKNGNTRLTTNSRGETFRTLLLPNGFVQRTKDRRVAKKRSKRITKNDINGFWWMVLIFLIIAAL